jgi:hypothetical protein
MKTCFELEIECLSFLISEYPDTPQEEVDETVNNVRDYGILYQPLYLHPFTLLARSTIAKRPERFGVRDLRNSDVFKQVLPEPVEQRLRLFWLDAEYRSADWSALQPALDTCRRLHRRLHDTPQAAASESGFSLWKPLSYSDGKSFLQITDWRNGDRRVTEIGGVARALYLYCMQVRTLAQILRRFAGAAKERTIHKLLRAFAAEKIVFVEDDKVLSLAVAPSPLVASRRIRRMHAEEKRDKRRLGVLVS